MKKLSMFLGFGALIAGSAFADPVSLARIVRDQTTFVGVELNSKTVFCTELGYGAVTLKVNVPELDHLAHFDHRVVGEGQPCIAAGACTGELSPEKIIDPNEPVAVIPVRVILTEHLTLDAEAGKCHRYLGEEVKSHIRGKDFFHHKGGGMVEVPLAICEKVKNL